MRYLVVYDICDEKRLNRVARILKDYGDRVQKSKFELEIRPLTLLEILARAKKVIEPGEDGIKYIPLCEKCQAKTEIIGKGRRIDQDEEFYVL